LAVEESEIAVKLIKAHVDGDPAILKRRVHFLIEEINSVSA
jgi:hypothetical protein